jgi:dienelactone hydrolase
MSFAGVMAWEDQRAADFLAEQPEVEAGRVAAMGLSMGGYRTWQLAAISDRIKVGVSICWMGTMKSMMVPGLNQTKGASAYSMLHPGLLADLDYPDIASIAAPKPMLFYSGRYDRLFPASGVQEAHAKLRAVWESQQAVNQLETRVWDVEHVFNVEMQEAAFDWLDGVLKKR